MTDENAPLERVVEIQTMFPDLTYSAAKALLIIVRFGDIDGAHHKTWVIDQVARILSGENYEALVKWACDGEYGPETYIWEEGIAP